MYEVSKTKKGGLIKLWTNGVDVEPQAMDQIKRVADMKFIFRHVAVMPDCHYGRGATVGTVIASKQAVIPAAVGVDIGCGMRAVKLDLKAEDLPESLGSLRHSIERGVPLGKNYFSQERMPQEFSEKFLCNLGLDFGKLINKHPKLKPKDVNPVQQVGTLGGGNHFIEICLDSEGSVWIMLHTGSRNIGHRIGNYFIGKAQEMMSQYQIELEDPDLAFLPATTEAFFDYMAAVEWAQAYASLNRQCILQTVLNCLTHELKRPINTVDSVIDCHHNYISREHHFNQNVIITRKGAVSAKKLEWGIIPGSMGARSFIVQGKGNAESYHSCSHGAGRLFSRTEAREKYTVEDLKLLTDGVECRKTEDIIDEIPCAYKDIDAVMFAQSDLVEPVYTLKQILCIKG